MDNVIKFVAKISGQSKFIIKTIIFGSRARGDGNERSDYDFAFELDPSCDNVDQIWSEFCVELREKNPSLNTLDLVRLDESSPELKEKIRQEGKVIYEQV